MRHLVRLLLLTFSLEAAAQLMLKRFREVGESVAYDGYLYFAAHDDTHGLELWRTDGTPENTVLFKDIKRGREGSGPQRFLVHEGQLLFLADDAQHGLEVWTTDGTSENTRRLTDFVPGTPGFTGRNWTVYQNRLLMVGEYDVVYEVFPSEGRIDCFATNCDEPLRAASLLTTDRALYSYSSYRSELAVYNGEEQRFETLNTAGFEDIDRVRYTGKQLFVAGVGKLGVIDEATRAITELASWPRGQYDDPEIDNLTGVGERLFFSVRLEYDYGEGEDSDALWVTDGTPAGTQRLKSFSYSPHSYHSEMMNFVAVDGQLYFAGNGGGYSSGTLWTSDGTPAGTREVVDASVSKYGSGDDIIARLTLWDDRLYFDSNSALGIYELNHPDSLYLFQDDFAQLSFKQGVSEQFYFTGGDQFYQELWVDDPQPKMTVSRTQISFGQVAVDSCSQQDVRITNVGRKNLYLSEASVSGNAFYVNSDATSNQLRPGTSLDLRLFYFPDTTGTNRGQLNLYSNDRSQPTVDVDIVGLALPRRPEDTHYCTGLNALSQQVDLDDPTSPVRCTSTAIDENAPAGTAVGELTAEGLQGDLTFTLVDGEGSRDNGSFYVEGNQLYTALSFDFERTNVVSLRVRVEGEGDPTEGILLFRVNDQAEFDDVSDCGPSLQYLDRGLDDVVFWDERTVIAVGPNTIIKSADGGATWDDISPKLPPDRYHSVASPGGGHLYVAGNTFLLKSVDGGEQWRTLTFSEGKEVATGLSFSDENHGFVSTLTGAIYRTTNQGRYWEYAGNIEVESRTYDQNTISSLAFSDSLTGFAGDTRGQVYRTLDGGSTWNEVSTNGISTLDEVTHLQVFSRDVVYLVNRKRGAYRTTTGGNNWVPVAPQHPGITHLHMMSNTEGYFFKENDGLYRTTDGGNQWSAVYQTSGVVLGIAGDPQHQRLVAVGRSLDTYSSDELPHKLILTAQNNDWQTVSYFPFREDMQLQWASASVGYATLRTYSERTTAYRTDDAGLTWQPFPLPSEERGVLDVHSEQVHGYTTYDHFYLTTDAGGNWTRKANDLRFTSVTFVSENTLCAVSYDRVIRSTDGGDNWNIVLSGVGIYGRTPFRFVDASTGFTYSGSEVLRTDDQGRSWRSLFLEEGVYLAGLQFIDASVGFFWTATSDYTDPIDFYRTVDGGSTWEKVPRQNNQKKLKPLFVSQDDGWAVLNETVFYTEDQGSNWRERYRVGGAREVELSYNGEALFMYHARSPSYQGGALQKLTEEAVPALAGNVAGERSVLPNRTYRYQGASLSNTAYQWSIVGGTIRRVADYQVWVHWHETAAERALTLTHSDGCGAVSTSQLSVTLTSESRTVTEEDPVTALEEEPTEPLVAYPNPVQQTLYIDSQDYGGHVSHLEITTIHGRRVPAAYQTTARGLSVDFSRLIPGLYLIKIVKSGGSSIIKVIKK